MHPFNPNETGHLDKTKKDDNPFFSWYDDVNEVSFVQEDFNKLNSTHTANQERNA